MFKINIDGKNIEAKAGDSILQASLAADIYIPHLCYHEDLSPLGGCRLCVVEIEGMPLPLTSCTTLVEDGMVVQTRTDRLNHTRKLAMELMLAGHPADCGTCIKYLNCELQSLKQYLVSDELSVKRRSRLFAVNSGNPLFVHDPNKCVVCGRCVRACQKIHGSGILFYKKKGKEAYIGTGSDLSLDDAGCRFCGVCAEVCPTGAIMDKEELTRGKNRRKALLPCKYSCPAEIDVPRYLRFIREGNYSSAVAVIREKVPFPLVLGYVCDQPCESVCRRGELNQPVAIRELKRFAVEKDEENVWQKRLEQKPATGKKIAVIGSGPSGLTAAFFLVNQGHCVTVFEALPQAGGMLRYGIPEYRLPRKVIDEEIRLIREFGVEIIFGTRVLSTDSLFKQGYNAILVASGALNGQKLSLPGSDCKGVLTGIDFLRDINCGTKVNVGRKVIVLGGGNVAFDCARVVLRCGAEQVSIACLESRENMPASNDEIVQGEEEGIIIFPSYSVNKILNSNGEIFGVEFRDVVSFSFDDNKNLQIEVDENSLHLIEADMVIFAIGQQPQIPEEFGLNLATRGTIEVDPYILSTSKEGVFAAGDAVTGTSSVIQAIASGRKIAVAIDRYLGGDGIIDRELAPQAESKYYHGIECTFARLVRCPEILISAKDRLKDFRQVVTSMDEKAACSEAKRCLECDIRLKISRVKFWGDY